jgi:hypothetical protein
MAGFVERGEHAPLHRLHWAGEQWQEFITHTLKKPSPEARSRIHPEVLGFEWSENDRAL